MTPSPYFYVSIFSESRIVGVTRYPDADRQARSEDGEVEQCGWLKDRYGLSWQIVPRVLPELLSDSDAEEANRVMTSMLQMVKLDIAQLQRAYDGEDVASVNL